MANIGRNDPCPCGSGKKYKKCCGNKGSGLSTESMTIIDKFEKEGDRIQKAHDFLFSKKKEVLNALWDKIDDFIFDYLSTEEFDNLYFDSVELISCFNCVGEYNRNKDDLLQHTLETIKHLVNENRLKEIVSYLYLKLPPLVDSGEYEKAWAILTVIEDLASYDTKKGITGNKINPIFLSMLIRGMEKMREEGKKTIFDVMENVGGLDKNHIRRISEDKILSFLKEKGDDVEFEKAMENYLEARPEMKKRAERLFEEMYLSAANITDYPEMKFLYFTSDELMPELKIIDMESTKLHSAITDAEELEQKMGKLLFECIQKALKGIKEVDDKAES